MFKATLKNAAIFKKVVDAVKDIVTDANFLCTGEGIQMQAMDSGHCALVTLTLLADGFLKYSCNKTMQLGIGMAGLARALGCVDGGDKLTIQANSDGDTIRLLAESNGGGRTAEFELRRLDIETDILQIPDVEYSASIKMPATELARLIKDIGTIGEDCRIKICGGGGRVIFSVDGDIGRASFGVAEDKTSAMEDEQKIIECGEGDVGGMFAVRYLLTFTKATKLCESVEIYMSEGVPLFVNYDMGELGAVGYYLAPKIEEE
jgi:proliferating cell nuclear antigen